MYHDCFSNFARRNCAFFSDAVPVHRVVRAAEFKMATGCKFLSLAASFSPSCSHFIFEHEEGKRGIPLYQTWHIVNSITLYHITSHSILSYHMVSHPIKLSYQIDHLKSLRCIYTYYICTACSRVLQVL